MRPSRRNAYAPVLAAFASAAAAQLPPAPPATFAPPAEEPAKAAPPPASTPAPAPAPAVGVTPPILESETSDTATLPPASPRRLFVATRGGGITIVNGDTAKVLGTVNSAGAAGFAIAPDNREFYVSETIWTRDNRGTRVDLLSIYDGTTLNLLHEVALPGRLIASGRVPYFSINASGTRGFVYNMEPAPSAIVVDLKRRRVLSTVETPGCGLVFPFRDEGFAALCADGTLASVAVDERGRGRITHSPVFFDAEKDPVFEESIVDRKTGEALFITYTGAVHPATLGATTRFAPSWSLQQAAGLGAGTTQPQHQTWRPGGRRPFAYHSATGRLFALMHDGKHWTQKEAGRELWVLDTRSRKLIRRFELPTSGYVVAVSQDASPQVYVVSENGWFWVLDPDTGRIERNLRDLGRPGLVAVTGF